MLTIRDNSYLAVNVLKFPTNLIDHFQSMQCFHDILHQYRKNAGKIAFGSFKIFSHSSNVLGKCKNLRMRVIELR